MNQTKNKFGLDLSWPEVFTNPELIESRLPSACCADAFCAWGNCCVGGPIPDNFGVVMAALSRRVGHGCYPLDGPGGLTEFAIQQGWLKPEPTV